MPKASVTRHGQHPDWDYVVEQHSPLAEIKEQPTILDTLGRLRNLKV